MASLESLLETFHEEDQDFSWEPIGEEESLYGSSRVREMSETEFSSAWIRCSGSFRLLSGVRIPSDMERKFRLIEGERPLFMHSLASALNDLGVVPDAVQYSRWYIPEEEGFGTLQLGYDWFLSDELLKTLDDETVCAELRRMIGALDVCVDHVASVVSALADSSQPLVRPENIYWFLKNKVETFTRLFEMVGRA